VWLPTAYERAPFSLEYVTFLVLLPIASAVLPAWFFYEITIANLTSATEDRATGLKRWFVVMTPLLVGAMTVPAATIPTGEPHVGFVIAASVVFVFLTFCIFVFQGDAVGPSRRVLVHWDRTGAGWLTRFFGPGIMKTKTLQLVMGASGLLLIGATGVAVAWFSPHVASADRVGQVERIAWFVEYAATYFVFLIGFAAWVRTKAPAPGTARVMLLVAIFATAAGPWIVAAIAGIISEGGRDALAVAAPSPFFAFVLLHGVTGSIREPAMAAGAVCSMAWTLIGMGLFVAAGTRSRDIIHRHHAVLAEADALLAKEDEAADAPDEPQPQGAAAAPAPDGLALEGA
jgi:hypothetical protein